MLAIVGGAYFERCDEPQRYEFFGSGLRAAAALGNKEFQIHFHSCVGESELELANIICDTFNIIPHFEISPSTITFHYHHPLARPEAYPLSGGNDLYKLSDVTSENILFYGQIEATSKVDGTFVVYDPQNGIRFKDTGSKAKHLSLVLNRNEAISIAGLPDNSILSEVGKVLLVSENAEVVVIKNGSQGALVIEPNGQHDIPAFDTSSVWPIGSGDCFSAAFAWKWMIEKLPAKDAALFASMYTANYCETRLLPLPYELKPYKPLPKREYPRKIYLAGPYFTVSERWLINELRELLFEFGNKVFSPFHDVGTTATDEQIVAKDLAGIQESDVMLAVLSGLDPGTIFEIGYAKALSKKVIILAENISDSDLTMMIGSGCVITSDLSTAIYKASW